MQAHLVLFALALCVLYQVLVLAWGSRSIYLDSSGRHSTAGILVKGLLAGHHSNKQIKLSTEKIKARAYYGT